MRLTPDEWVAALGIDVPRDELLQRLHARNANLPSSTFHIEVAQLDEYWRVFEPPAIEELTSDE